MSLDLAIFVKKNMSKYVYKRVLKYFNLLEIGQITLLHTSILFYS